ncbi:Phenylacetate-coenzyme A ligase [bioreactor metagenome]|uniref:Phenylacetate-coenzyme A ligase n=1 Tax=bioreactor metagenome TaxID=1076179 RepID=A0A645AG21_9ZZZZ
MYWNNHIEKLSREEMAEIQSGSLRDLVQRAYSQVPSYRQKFQAAGLLPEDIQGIGDIHKLPFTTKQDLRDNYPYGLFALPMSEIVRIHASSGTTGKPTVVGYTKRDLNMWAEVMARALTAVGVTNKSFIQNAYGYGLFTGALGVHYGAELIGGSLIPTSVGNTARQITLMKDFGTSVLACTPSYALHIAEMMREAGVDCRDLPLQVGIFGAEPWSEQMRQEIQRQLNIKAYDIYGLSEIIGPGVACECNAQDGMHINGDHFYPEIINPVTGEVLPDGERGELVITTLTKEGLPLIRYRTRDLTVLNREVCSCGRTLVRMNKVMGRSDDMLIIGGVNVFPSQVESVLLDMGMAPHYQLIVERIDNLDKLTILVEITEEVFTDEVRGLEILEHKLQKKMGELLGISSKVRLVSNKTIERSEGKAKRVIDKRKI